MAAHLLIAGTEMPGSGSTMLDVERISGSPKRSAERARRAGAAWDVDQVPGAGRVDVERLTAVLMVARTCSRARTHGRGRRCGVGSQAHRAPSHSLE